MVPNLPVRLRLLVPAVENAISRLVLPPRRRAPEPEGPDRRDRQHGRGGTPHPGRRPGARGRREPRVVVDFATLTGAARVALGPDLPAFFTEDDELAAAIERCGFAVNDPVWRLPLWPPYAGLLDQDRRREPYRRSHGGLDHGGAFPPPVRHAGRFARAFRPFHGPRRRSPDAPRAARCRRRGSCIGSCASATALDSEVARHRLRRAGAL